MPKKPAQPNTDPMSKTNNANTPHTYPLSEYLSAMLKTRQDQKPVFVLHSPSTMPEVPMLDPNLTPRKRPVGPWMTKRGPLVVIHVDHR